MSSFKKNTSRRAAAQPDTETINLADLLEIRPHATYLLTVKGDSMVGDGIVDGGRVLVDRNVEARHGHIVVASIDGHYTLKRLYKQNGEIRLLPSNDKYPPIIIKRGQDFKVWGVVTNSFKRHC